jgi:hypothetical protein
MEIKAEKLEKLNTTAEEPTFWEWVAAGAAAVAAIAKLISMS